MTQSIRTRWLAPTNTKGARVIATATGAGNKAKTVIGWDWALSQIDNHRHTAHAFAVAMNWAGRWTPVDDGNDGFLFIDADKLALADSITTTEAPR